MECRGTICLGLVFSDILVAFPYFDICRYPDICNKYQKKKKKKKKNNK